jgi:hypothetical protein
MGGGEPHPNLQEPTIHSALSPPITEHPDSYRPPVPWNPYYRPQHDVFSPLDSDPIVRRIFAHKGATHISAPWLHNKYLGYFSIFLGAVTFPMLLLYRPFTRQQIEDMVKYDPKYFPEFAKDAK